MAGRLFQFVLIQNESFSEKYFVALFLCWSLKALNLSFVEPSLKMLNGSILKWRSEIPAVLKKGNKKESSRIKRIISVKAEFKEAEWETDIVYIWIEIETANQVHGWSKIRRTTKDIFPFPESNQNLRIIIGIIFKLNYGKRTWVCSSFRRSKRDIDIFECLTLCQDLR